MTTADPLPFHIAAAQPSERWLALSDDRNWRFRHALAIVTGAYVFLATLAGLAILRHDNAPGIVAGTSEGISVEMIDVAELEKLALPLTAGRDKTVSDAMKMASLPPQVEQPLQLRPSPPERDAPPVKPAPPAPAEHQPRPNEQAIVRLADSDIAALLASPLSEQLTLQHDRKRAPTRLPVGQSAPQIDGGENLETMMRAALAHHGAVSAFTRAVARVLDRSKPVSHGIHGWLVVEFVIMPNGSIGNLTVTQSSRTAELDAIVLNALQHAVFPTPVSDLSLAERTFSITYKYN